MRSLLGGLTALCATLMLCGCGASFPDSEASSTPVQAPTIAVDEEPRSSEDQWVVVTFGGAEEPMPAGWMDALLPAELNAVEALEASGIGFIDGNEIGNFSYQLYFVASDAPAMWEIISPHFADAPVTWTRVELRDGLEDSHPTVLER